MQDISLKGKGAIRESKDTQRNTLKDHLSKFGAPVLPASYDLTSLYIQFPVEDQGVSSSCAGQAFGGYAQVKTLKRDNKILRLSKKDIYQNIFLQGGGARGSDAVARLENHGVCLESSIPSYQNGVPPSEEYMEGMIPRDPQAETDGMARIFSNALTFNGSDINEVKQAIYGGDGAVCALWGNNESWVRPDGIVTIPNIPPDNNSLWGHFVILIGWNDVGKTIKCKSSWGSDIGDGGYFHIPYEYFTKGYAMSEYTLVEMPVGSVPVKKKLIMSIITRIIELLQAEIGQLQGGFSKLVIK